MNKFCRKSLSLLLFLGIVCTLWSQQTRKVVGIHIQPSLEIHEVGAEINLSLQFNAGIYYRNFTFQAYYAQLLEPAFIESKEENQNELFRTRFYERGLGVHYFHRANDFLNVFAGVKAGDGQITILDDTDQDLLEDDIFQIRPEIGAELILNPTMRLSFQAGFRQIFGLEAETPFEDADFNSLVSSLGLRFVF